MNSIYGNQAASIDSAIIAVAKIHMRNNHCYQRTCPNRYVKQVRLHRNPQPLMEIIGGCCHASLEAC